MKESQKIVKLGQSLLDYTLQHYGSVQGLIDVMKRNDLSLLDRIEPGAIYTVPVTVSSVVSYTKANKITFASYKNEELFKGIGYMKIGSTFIVK